jgi:hypothetical protein
VMSNGSRVMRVERSLLIAHHSLLGTNVNHARFADRGRMMYTPGSNNAFLEDTECDVPLSGRSRPTNERL